MKKIIIASLILFVSTSPAIAENPINISGNITQILDNGQELRLKKIIISINKTDIESTPSGENGNFSIIESNSSLPPGQKINIELHNTDYFILSPFNGDMYLPNKNSNINIKAISKNSKLYFFLKKEIYDFSIQVVATHNEKNAIDIMNKLKEDGYEDAHYESYSENNTPSFLYKVKLGRTTDKNKAIELKKEIRKKYTKFKKSFISIHVGDKDYETML